MIPGDIADATGNLCIQWWSSEADRRLPPDGLGKLSHGRVWVTPEQAAIARMFAWQTVQETSGLMAVERSEIDARTFHLNTTKAPTTD